MPRQVRRRRACALALAVATIGLQSGCAPVLGVPRDPENPGLFSQSDTLTKLEASFAPSEDEAYRIAQPESRETIRNDIVLRRVRALNLEFSNFEERLYGDSNGVGTGGDLLLLVLNGLGATTGSIGTKAALAAASAGIVGAQAAISKDLFFQRTIPALMAQMESNRAAATTRILKGLARTDGEYPLIRAEIDLDALKRAASIPSAITTITSQASDERATQVALQAGADAAFIDSRPARRRLSDRAKTLTDPQAVTLANQEITTLSLIPVGESRNALAQFVPSSGSFGSRDGPRARQFLEALFQAGRSDDALRARWSSALKHLTGAEP